MNCNFRKLIELIIKENTGPEETTAEVIEKIKAQKYAVEAFIEATTKGTLVAGMSESQKDQIENMSPICQSVQRSDRLPRRSERG